MNQNFDISKIIFLRINQKSYKILWSYLSVVPQPFSIFSQVLGDTREEQSKTLREVLRWHLLLGRENVSERF